MTNVSSVLLYNCVTLALNLTIRTCTIVMSWSQAAVVSSATFLEFTSASSFHPYIRISSPTLCMPLQHNSCRRDAWGPAQLSLRNTPTHPSFHATPTQMCHHAACTQMLSHATPTHISRHATATNATLTGMCLNATPTGMCINATPTRMCLNATPTRMCLNYTSTQVSIRAVLLHARVFIPLL